MQETIQLMPVTVDGVTHLQDQHGRKLDGVHMLTIKHTIGGVVSFEIEGVAFRNGKLYRGMSGYRRD
jgi:hypothetical protein